MTLADIDAAVTRRVIQEIADESKAAFKAQAHQSAEIDAASREALAKEDADLKAVQDRRAELDAAREAAERAKAAEEAPPVKETRPSTLSLGADEFKQEREARKAVETPAPPPQPEQQPQPVEEAARPNRTLKLGGRGDEDTPREPPREPPQERVEPAPQKPVRRRPAPAEGDDDMSGRTWLR